MAVFLSIRGRVALWMLALTVCLVLTGRIALGFEAKAIVQAPVGGAAVPKTAAPVPAQAPAQVPTQNSANTALQLFGTVEFKGPVKNLPEWSAMLERNAANPVFVTNYKLNAHITWDKLQALLKNKPALEQIKDVNSFWNQWPYRLDIEAYGKNDYWAAPYEFIKNSGDCEDYAISKYFTFKALGYNPDHLRIVVVKDSIRNFVHAVLAVYVDNEIYILDNLSKVPLSHTRLKNYVPQYSVNESSRWVHVRPK